jgi:hypothetical protein
MTRNAAKGNKQDIKTWRSGDCRLGGCGKSAGKVISGEKTPESLLSGSPFFSCQEIVELLDEAGFGVEQIWQTVFGKLSEIKEIQQPKPGSGDGGFVVVRARKIAE